MRRPCVHRHPVRRRLGRLLVLISLALVAGWGLAALPRSVWAGVGVVVLTGSVLWAARSLVPARQPAPPTSGSAVVASEATQRIDWQSDVAVAQGAIAALVCELAERVEPAELAVAVVSWHPRHAMAVLDVLSGATSGHSEKGATWLARQPVSTRWWWAALERDIRQAALGSRTTVADVLDGRSWDQALETVEQAES